MLDLLTVSKVRCDVSNVSHPFNQLLGLNLPDIESKAQWRNWETWRLSVNEIEELIKLDFFSNIPTQIQEIVESYTGSAISASLLAESPTSGIDPFPVSHNSSVGHDGITQQSFWATTDTSIAVTIPQLGTCQVSSIETSNTDIHGISQVSIGQISTNELSQRQVSTSEISTSQIGTSQFSPAQIGSAQVGSSQINIIQASSGEISSTEINTTQNIETGIVVHNVFRSDNTIAHIDPTKISFPSSISPVQLFSSNLSHTNTFLLNTIYSTAQTLWQNTTPINLNFQITNLPNGQLAEATITGYNSKRILLIGMRTALL